MKDIKKLQNYIIILTILFISVTSISMILNIMHINQKQNKLVLEHAKNAFTKDLMFRKWVAMHGGVYVFPTEKTPPNPYLFHIKDRDLYTKDGRKLTLMNPAYTLRELMNNFSGMYGEKGHITSLKLLNPKNKADNWETKVLKNFDKKLYTEYYEIYNYQGSEHLRYMRALETKQECLKCHAHQNYKIGDTRGGVSITIPMEKYNNDGVIEKKFIIISHILISIIGSIFIFIIYKRIKKSIQIEKELEVNLKEKEKLFAEQSKMASLGEMLGNIAHQWRQPLSVITTSASGLKIENEFQLLTDEKLNSSVDSIVNSSNYLSQTIDDFRDFIKDDKKIISFNLKENINKNLEILKGNTKVHDINILLECEEEIILNSYPNELTQVFINIIHNSIDALKINKIKKRYIFIKAYKDKDTVTIEINDNAKGIQEDIIHKIFEPYITTKHQYQGTGLGLYISYKLINESMKGKITVLTKYSLIKI